MSKQLEANRANAKKSTGPKSQEGKARSSFNSRKHGLTAKTLVIGDENPADFDELRSGLMEQYDPQSAMEVELVERIAGLLWRLRRIPVFEAAIMRQAEVDERKSAGVKLEGLAEDAIKLRILGVAFIRHGVDTLGKLARHETTIMHLFIKTVQMLQFVQRTRSSNRGEMLIIGHSSA